MKDQQKTEHRWAQSRLCPPQHDTQEEPTGDRKLALRGGSGQRYISLFNCNEEGLDANALEVDPHDDPLHTCEEENASERPLSMLDEEHDISERPLSTLDAEQGIIEDISCQHREFAVEQQHREGGCGAEQMPQLESHGYDISEPIQDTSARHYVPSFDIPGYEAFINPIEPPTFTQRGSGQQGIDETEEIELEERRAIAPMPTEREVGPSEREPTIQSAIGHINTHTDQTTQDTIVEIPAQAHQQPTQGQQQPQLDVPQDPPKYVGDGPGGPPCWEWCLCAPLRWCGQQVVGVWIYLQHNWFEPMYALLLYP